VCLSLAVLYYPWWWLQEMDKLLVEKIDQPAMDFSDSVSEKTLATIVQLIVDEEGNGS
jgi:hypothetical protein